MIGITSYGAYIPRYRINRKTIFSAMGWFNPATAAVARGEKAIANYDEDSITMAVEASNDCISKLDRNMIDGLYLASTTAPYNERQNACICSTALALRPDVRTADFSASLKSGTTALMAACEAVKSGFVSNLLVAAADTRIGKPGSAQEHVFGDGAAALLVGQKDVIAELKNCHSVSRDFVEYRRTQDERFLHTWEERWGRDEGYDKIIPEGIEFIKSKWAMDIASFAKIIISCPSFRNVLGIAKKIGAKPEQMQDNLESLVGDTGNALSLIMLGAALEDSNPGDKILVVSYGNGCDFLSFEVTDKILQAKQKVSIQKNLQRRHELNSYMKYLVFRDLIPLDIGIRGEERGLTRYSVLYREGKKMAALCGSKCTACGTPQYPAARICINPDCGAIDQTEDYHFYDKIGIINSYTGDNLAFSVDPPEKYGLVDFEAGGRLYLDITDCNLDELKVGLPVKMSFRRKFVDKRRGVYAYFWKAIPVV